MHQEHPCNAWLCPRLGHFSDAGGPLLLVNPASLVLGIRPSGPVKCLPFYLCSQEVDLLCNTFEHHTPDMLQWWVKLFGWLSQTGDIAAVVVI